MNGGEPILFETMVFDNMDNPMRKGESLTTWAARCRRDTAARGLDETVLDTQERWHDWTEAEKGHESVVRWVEKRAGASRSVVEGLAHLVPEK
jgi:CDP-diacylglycerol pyrophosphatase